MKTLAAILIKVCLALAVLQWWQIVYRLLLFYRDYQGKRYVNHIGDDVFTIIHVVNVVLLSAGVYAVWTFWHESAAWRRLVISVAVANLAAWLTFIYMHATGILVGYMEFIRHWQGQ